MGSYAGDHNASRPQTGKRTTNNFDEPKQQRHLGTASNEITWGGGGGGGEGAAKRLRSTNRRP